MRKTENCPDCRRYRRKCGEMEQNRVENAITRVTAAMGGEPKVRRSGLRSIRVDFKSKDN